MNKYEQIKGMANPNRGSLGVQEARPPQRTEQPAPVQQVTDWQITEWQVEAALKAAHMHSTPESRKDMRRAIEAALREALAEQSEQQESVRFKCTVIDDANPNGVPLERWGQQPAQQEPVALDVTLDGEEAQALYDQLGNDREDLSPVRLIVGKGHSGYGLYVAQAEYQDEGVVFIASVISPQPAPVQNCFVCDGKGFLSEGGYKCRRCDVCSSIETKSDTSKPNSRSKT